MISNNADLSLIALLLAPFLVVCVAFLFNCGETQRTGKWRNEIEYISKNQKFIKLKSGEWLFSSSGISLYDEYYFETAKKYNQFCNIKGMVIIDNEWFKDLLLDENLPEHYENEVIKIRHDKIIKYNNKEKNIDYKMKHPENLKITPIPIIGMKGGGKKMGIFSNLEENWKEYLLVGGIAYFLGNKKARETAKRKLNELFNLDDDEEVTVKKTKKE